MVEMREKRAERQQGEGGGREAQGGGRGKRDDVGANGTGKAKKGGRQEGADDDHADEAGTGVVERRCEAPLPQPRLLTAGAAQCSSASKESTAPARAPRRGCSPTRSAPRRCCFASPAGRRRASGSASCSRTPELELEPAGRAAALPRRPRRARRARDRARQSRPAATSSATASWTRPSPTRAPPGARRRSGRDAERDRRRTAACPIGRCCSGLTDAGRRRTGGGPCEAAGRRPLRARGRRLRKIGSRPSSTGSPPPSRERFVDRRRRRGVAEVVHELDPQGAADFAR